MANNNESSCDLFIAGKSIIKDLTGFTVEIRAGFDGMCNLKITKEVKPDNLKGLTYPENFKFKKLIDAEDFNYLASQWAPFAEEIQSEAGEAFWKGLINPKSTGNNNPLSAYSEKILQADQMSNELYKEVKPDNCISVYPDRLKSTSPIPESFIPERSWFKKEMRDIEIKDFLTIFGETEQEVLSIEIGRALVGATGTTHAESDREIVHTYRTFPVLYGEDPGLGKSDFFNYFLRPALKMSGYRVPEIKTLHEKFGLGEVALGHIAYKDDMTSDEFLKNLSSIYTKTLVTGGTIQAEQKYIKSFPAYCQSVLLVNVNAFDMHKLAMLDEGILSRVAILRTLTRLELSQWKPYGASRGSKSPCVKNHLHFLSQKYNVSLKVLALWFMRLCTDKFMRLIDTPETMAKGHNKLADKIFALYKELSVQINHALMVKNTCILFQFAYKLRNPTLPIPDLEVEDLAQMLADGTYLVVVKELKAVREKLGAHWEKTGKPESHPYIAIKNLRVSSMIEAIDRLNLVVKTSKNDVREGINAVFKSLIAKSGFVITYSHIKVITSWDNARTYINSSIGKDVMDYVMGDLEGPSRIALTKAQENTINEIKRQYEG